MIPALDQQQTAAYIADMSFGLMKLAEKADLTLLKHLFEIARAEAMQHSKSAGRRGPPKP
jgi:hypothetical protein